MQPMLPRQAGGARRCSGSTMAPVMLMADAEVWS